ncbi:hypothetical protein QL285_001795 [Trifolium repens]|nr:hypothetical protein QL285_001795 [Trifolium repens]
MLVEGHDLKITYNQKYAAQDIQYMAAYTHLSYESHIIEFKCTDSVSITHNNIQMHNLAYQCRLYNDCDHPTRDCFTCMNSGINLSAESRRSNPYYTPHGR